MIPKPFNTFVESEQWFILVLNLASVDLQAQQHNEAVILLLWNSSFIHNGGCILHAAYLAGILVPLLSLGLLGSLSLVVLLCGPLVQYIARSMCLPTV